MTVMVVWKPVTVSSKQAITGGIDPGSLAYFPTNGSPSVQDADIGFVEGLGTGTATSTAGNIYQTNMSYTTSAAPTFRFNKAADATQSGATGAITYQLDSIGQADGGSYFNGYVGAIYIFSPALDTTDIESWEATLSCKYPGA